MKKEFKNFNHYYDADTFLDILKDYLEEIHENELVSELEKLPHVEYVFLDIDFYEGCPEVQRGVMDCDPAEPAELDISTVNGFGYNGFKPYIETEYDKYLPYANDIIQSNFENIQEIIENDYFDTLAEAYERHLDGE